MPTVRVKSGTNAGLQYEVGDAPLLMGRDDRAEIQILDQGVSRRHAEIFRMGEMYFIRDLDSRNGTFVNEERIKEELLRDGDEFRIGSTVIQFEDRTAAPHTPIPAARRVRVAEGADATTTIHIEDVFAADADDLVEPGQRTGEQSDLKLLYRASHVIAEARDTQTLLETLVRLAGEAVQADHACIFVRKEGTREFELEATFQPEAMVAKGTPPVVSTRVIQECVQTSRAVMSVDEAAAAQGEGGGPSGRPRGVIVAPLVALDQLHGVLYCASHDDAHRFAREDLDLITAIALQLGIALQGLLAVQRQERVLISAVRTLASALEMRDPTYVGHSARVAGYCSGIAQALKLPRSESRRIQLAALLHNVGQIVLPVGAHEDDLTKELLNKRNDATEKLVRRIEGLEFILPVVRHYNERMDGSGTPDGLPGEKIPLAARILGVADRLDSLMVRGEKPVGKYSLKDALLRVRSESPQKFDPRIVDALIIAHRGGYLLAPTERILTPDPDRRATPTP
jgi:HD-GYP domain-containing protein (c-di-GMP phosphodiesterase class II)